MPLWIRHVAVIALLALAACGDGEGTTPADNDDSTPTVDLDPTPDPAADDFCGRLGWFCTPKEAPQGALARSDTVLAEVKVQVEGGISNTEAVTWLLEQRDVVEAAATDGAVVFRVEGAPPTWLLTPRFRPGVQPTATPIEPARQDVVGRDTPRDNEDRRKSALLLAPYLFQFASNDPTPTIGQILRGARDYNHSGGTTTVQNASAPGLPASGTSTGQPKLADFRGWDAHDVIVVSTHGAEMGANSFGCSIFSDFLTCIIGISTGERLNACSDIATLYPDATGVRCAGTSGVDGVFVLLDTDFFDFEYGVFAPGLRKSIVFMGGCQTSTNSSLAFNLGGSTSEYFGWDDSVYIDEMAAPAIRLFELMVNDGLSTEDAFDRLEDEGLDETTNADLELRSNDGGLHIREVATLKNPLQPSGSGVSAPNTGAARLATTEVGDLEAVGSWPLAGEQARRIDDATMRLRIRQPLDYDVEQGRSVLLEVRAQLPNGGWSLHEVPVSLENPALHFESRIESRTNDLVTRSRVQADIELAFRQAEDPDRLELDASVDVLEYLEYTIDAPAPGCTVTTSTTDGRLEVRDGEFQLDPSASEFGIPEELLLVVYPEIKDSWTLNCLGVSQTAETIFWFSGFVSFHAGALGDASEFDESRGGFALRDWEAGSGGAWARKEYRRQGQDDGVTYEEETVLEVRGPSYRGTSTGIRRRR